jgi:UDP-N-acetylglucosamine--N-acetylmuramyl-(pentapeptide) pyrophosphoryl-undecaprenol N-acetylglucosamine transferase
MSEPLVAVFSGGGTGGHLYPALALAAALRERRPDVKPFFVGSERGLEARILPERGLDHLLVPIEGFRRDSLLRNLRVLRLLARGIRQVVDRFKRLRPQIVVVTGGYAGGPAGIAAVLTRTRLVLQEQNSLPGVTTRVLSLFAREVHLAFPEAVDALPPGTRGKAKLTGNPVREPVGADRRTAAAALGLDPDQPIVLVTGGSQGSQALNRVVLDAVYRIIGRSSDVQLLWATGSANLEEVEAAINRLGHPGWVHLVGYLDDMPLALAAADLAVSRAGAMATSEFLAWGLPAILIPLPTAAENHQEKNAHALSEAGAAVHVPQDSASGEILWQAVEGLLSDRTSLGRMSELAAKRGRATAAREIAASLDGLLPRPTRQVPGQGVSRRPAVQVDGSRERQEVE